jgi:transcription initiation factor TFIIB
MVMLNKPKEKIEIDEVEHCPECNSSHLEEDYERGELVCADCGLVISENLIDPGQEWRGFDAEQNEKRARTGAPTTYTVHDKGLSTEISWKNVDIYGKSVPTRNKPQLYRMRKWQKRLRAANAVERNLMVALASIERISSNMSLPKNVREEAAVIYRKAAQRDLIRGRSIEGVVAASIYAAARQLGFPRAIEEIARASRVSRKEIGRNYRTLVRELKLALLPTTPQDYISRFCSELNLGPDVEQKALEILKQMEANSSTVGKGPTGIAAAAIYIASILCGKKRTQEEIANVSGVTEVTLRNRFKDITRTLKLEAEI